ncbi:hypothetical protein AC331_21110 [Salmonella enterica subsp. enterica]|nr:hypothetical protein [Salmonella enterica subsp. enterica serovar Lome]EAM4704848.1 hypothetical protein [Salmonella enterica]EAW1595488.1 hypothetical protein [Salmonella enterica subsp. enterica]EBG2763037.1 hypothetical protein [Salmonella enterica subsp. enterica serovar Ridge]EBQ9589059.1 hypothetical protein [Salmonella enterica subsp. enterica serovar Penarth]EBS5542849.1 hypothetical protein [Salmonella enterica subsp. enterica serovar Plymouth]EBY3808396.1 hypothetical protein [Sa
MKEVAASIANLQHHSPSFIFTCSDAITDSNAFIREALRFYTDCQSLLKTILHPMRPQLR